MSFGLQDTEKSSGNWVDASSLQARFQVLEGARQDAGENNN